MALTDLSVADMDYYRNYVKKMKSCHEREFLMRINPRMMRAFYRGMNRDLPDEQSRTFNETDYKEYWNDTENFLQLSRIFQATNTILPNVYYQNPSPIITGVRGGDEDSAALMSALIKFYMKLNNAKVQNQEAVMNAWFFGIGWKKLGYKTVFFPKDEVAQEPETVLDKVTDTFQGLMGMKPDNLESKEKPDIVDYEQLFNNSESPMNVYLDHKSDLLNCKAINHALPRSLYDLETYGDYDPQVLAELVEKMRYDKGSRMDSRDVELHLNELHIQQRNGVWILTYVDEFPKPLRYEKSSYLGKGFQFCPLVFTNEPGVRYPVSHMRVASQVQDCLDKQASLFMDIVSRVRNQILINEKALQPGQRQAIEENRTGGVIWTNKDISPAIYAQLTSASVSNDIPLLMNITQQNLTEILGADEQLVGGNSKNKTLGQDELARVGSKVRESGMQDKVRDWMIEQMQKEGSLLKQFSNAQISLQITGQDYVDPKIGLTCQQKWAEFMSESNPLGAKNYLQGEYDFDCNMEDAVKPDKQSQQAQYEKMIVTSSTPVVAESLLQAGYRPRVDMMYKQWAKTFEGIGNPDAFLEQLTSQQIAAIQTAQMLKQGGGMLPQPNMGQSSKPKGVESPEKPSQVADTSNPSSKAAKL